MTEDTAGAPDALAALREQLPACASELEGRLASVEDIAGRLAAGMEDVDAFQGHLDGVMATIDGLSLPLEELPEGAAGAAMQAILEPVASALESAKETAIAPLRDLQASLDQFRELLGQVAAAAEQTVAMFRDGLDRLTAAIAHCDDMADVVDVVAGETAALVSGGEGVSVDETLEEWRTLGPDIDAAQAAL